jgi:hypothetical protein
VSNMQYRPDTYGHTQPRPTSGDQVAVLAAGAVSTTAQGTIAPTTAAGASPTVTFATGQVAVDECGTFTLSPVTGGGSQAAGAVAEVFFNQAFETIPKGVTVNICDNAAGSSQVAVAASAQSITAAGFTINVSAALTTAHTYQVTYIVKV